MENRFSDILKSLSRRTPLRRRKQTQSNYSEQHLHRGHIFGWVIAGLVLVAVIAFFAALAVRGSYSPMMAYYGYPAFGGWFFFPFGFFFIFFIIFALSRLIFWPWGWGWRRGNWYHYSDAREILRQRYARGEITKEQFDQMMRDLEQH